MPTQTTVLQIDYPAEFDNPFHVVHATGMEEIDLWLRTVWEDASLVVVGGGNMTLVADLFSWDAPIEIMCGRSGALITVPADSFTITDGQIAWLNGVSRPIVTDTLSSITAGGAPGPGWDKTKIPLFYRSGSNVYLFRNVIGLERVTVPVP